jgi:hypothetical protein
MTYDKILQIGTSSAHQHGFGSDKKRRITIKYSIGTGETIWHLQTSGLPLCTRSRNDWETGSRPGCKDCFYGEAVQEFDQSTSKICKDHRAKPERDSESSAGSLFAKRSEAWLRGENAPERSSWNTAMIGCHRKK